jgi:hypothetical protein
MDTPAQACAGSLTPPLEPRPWGAAGSRRPARLRVIATVQDPRAVQVSSSTGPARAAARRGIELTIAKAGVAADVCPAVA